MGVVGEEGGGRLNGGCWCCCEDARMADLMMLGLAPSLRFGLQARYVSR
jgi:hypothetical protein